MESGRSKSVKNGFWIDCCVFSHFSQFFSIFLNFSRIPAIFLLIFALKYHFRIQTI